jgi:Pyridoxamine 5'-phosphate oxidase
MSALVNKSEQMYNIALIDPLYLEELIMLNSLIIPRPQPVKKIPGYKMPEDDQHLLTWDFVAEQMSNSRYYWLSSSNVKGYPHVVPVWGVWYENRIHFDGSYKTAWSINLNRDPHIAVHLPSGDQVVIIEGLADPLGDDDIDSDTWKKLDSAFQTKYNVEQGSPYWVVYPSKVLAWDNANLQSMTRWIFADS